jgi:predicted DNA-binding transcriptional regulator AlpA
MGESKKITIDDWDSLPAKEKLKFLGITYKNSCMIPYEVLSKYEGQKNVLILGGVFAEIYSMTIFGEDHVWRASREDLAIKLHIGLSTVIRAIEQLMKDNLVTDETPKEFTSKTQVRWYQANIEEFKKLKITRREKTKTLNTKEKALALANKTLIGWGVATDIETWNQWNTEEEPDEGEFTYVKMT